MAFVQSVQQQEYAKQMVICPWCGGVTRPLFKHGHAECGRCNKPLSDCCDGERAEPKVP